MFICAGGDSVLSMSVLESLVPLPQLSCGIHVHVWSSNVVFHLHTYMFFFFRGKRCPNTPSSRQVSGLWTSNAASYQCFEHTRTADVSRSQRYLSFARRSFLLDRFIKFCFNFTRGSEVISIEVLLPVLAAHFVPRNFTAFFGFPFLFLCLFYQVHLGLRHLWELHPPRRLAAMKRGPCFTNYILEQLLRGCGPGSQNCLLSRQRKGRGRCQCISRDSCCYLNRTSCLLLR